MFFFNVLPMIIPILLSLSLRVECIVLLMTVILIM